MLFSVNLNFLPTFLNLVVDLSTAADLRVESKIKPSKSKASSNKPVLSHEGIKTKINELLIHMLQVEQSLNTPSFCSPQNTQARGADP